MTINWCYESCKNVDNVEKEKSFKQDGSRWFAKTLLDLRLNRKKKWKPKMTDLNWILPKYR